MFSERERRENWVAMPGTTDSSLLMTGSSCFTSPYQISAVNGKEEHYKFITKNVAVEVKSIKAFIAQVNIANTIVEKAEQQISKMKDHNMSLDVLKADNRALYYRTRCLILRGVPE